MKLLALRRRRQAHRAKKAVTQASIQQAFTWSRRWDLPLNEIKSHRLSIGGPPDLRLAISEKAGGKSLQKCEQINGLGITVNSEFTPSANVLTAANEAKTIELIADEEILTVHHERVLTSPWPSAC